MLMLLCSVLGRRNAFDWYVTAQVHWWSAEQSAWIATGRLHRTTRYMVPRLAAAAGIPWAFEHAGPRLTQDAGKPGPIRTEHYFNVRGRTKLMTETAKPGGFRVTPTQLRAEKRVKRARKAKTASVPTERFVCAMA